MNGLVALGIILGIIAVIIILFSIKFTVTLSYNETFKADFKWFFVKRSIFPKEEKPEEEGKKKKKKKKKGEEEPSEEESEEKKKGDNMFVSFYKNQGFSGVIKLIDDTVSALGGFFGSVFKHLVFKQLKLYITVGAGDSAETAILYGKTCAYVFPAMGLITSKCKVKEYCCDIQPNFMEADKSAVFYTVITSRPIFITNALIVLAVRLLFKVVIKLLNNKETETEKKEIPAQQKKLSKRSETKNENNLKEENKS